MMEHLYREGEKVLVFDPTIGRARVMYEAKVCFLSQVEYEDKR